MSDQIKQIAERLQGLRDVLELTPDEVAKSCQLSVDEYLEMCIRDRDRTPHDTGVWIKDEADTMKLHIVDILIICAYLMVIVAIGLFLKKDVYKRQTYFCTFRTLRTTISTFVRHLGLHQMFQILSLIHIFLTHYRFMQLRAVLMVKSGVPNINE